MWHSAGTPASTIDGDDLTLISQVATGDQSAFEVLYQRYSPRLIGYLQVPPPSPRSRRRRLSGRSARGLAAGRDLSSSISPLNLDLWHRLAPGPQSRCQQLPPRSSASSRIGPWIRRDIRARSKLTTSRTPARGRSSLGQFTGPPPSASDVTIYPRLFLRTNRHRDRLF